MRKGSLPESTIAEAREQIMAESTIRPSASVPSFRRVMSGLLGEPLLVPMRRVSTSDKLYAQSMRDSPLHDLAPVALPGLTSRVSRNASVALSLHELGAAFEKQPDEDQVMHIEGGFSRPLLVAALLSVACAWNNGFMSGSMNTAAASMRRSIGIFEDTPENDVVWGLCVRAAPHSNAEIFRVYMPRAHVLDPPVSICR